MSGGCEPCPPPLCGATEGGQLGRGIRADEFYFERHQVLFVVFRELYERGVTIDVITAQQALKDRGQYEKVGGVRALGELLDRSGTVANLSAYVQIVREKAALRRVMQAAQAVETAGHQGYDGAVEAALEQLEIARAERQEVLHPASSWAHATDINAAVVDRDTPQTLVVSSGLPGLDEHLPAGGFEGGNLIVAIAAPKVGKTTYALGTVAVKALEAGGRVLYCALSDAGVVRLNLKLLCGQSGVPLRAVKARNLTAQQHADWLVAADRISSWKLHIERIRSAKAIIARAKQLARLGDLVLVVVDYLQRMSNGQRESWQDMAESTQVLQDGAVDLGIPVLALSQPTTTARREGKKIKASDTKGGGTAEEDADLVLLLTKGTKDTKAAGLELLAGRDVEPMVWHAEAGVVDGVSVYPCGWRWDYTRMRLEAGA